MQKKYFFILFVLYFPNCFSQEKLDSLRQLIKSTKIDSVKIEAYSAYAGLLWGKDWDSAKIYSKKSYDLSVKTNSHKGKAMNLINFGVYEEVNGDFNKANRFFSDAFKILKRHKDEKLLASYFYNFGNLKYAEGKNDSASYYYKKGITLFQKLGKLNNVAKIKQNLASLELLKGNYNDANKTYFSLIPIYTKFKDYKNLSSLYNQIGLTFTKMAEYEKSIQYYTIALDIAKKHNINENIALSYLNMGCSYGELKRLDYAEKYFRLSKEIYGKAGIVDGQISCDVNICELLIRRKEYKKANEIIDLILTKDISNAYDYINAYKSKGICLLRDNKDGSKYLQEAYDVTIQTKLNNQLPEILSLLIESNLKNKDDLKTLKYFNEYDSISKILNSEQNKKEVFDLETKYRTAEKDIQIQKEKTNKNIALSSIGLLLLLGLSGFWFYRSKQNQTNLKTQNTLLGLQQNLIEAELSNLNKQLDPHEIKNLLAHISPEIQEKAPESYKKMLKLFNLTKASLNSNSITDTIENQVKQIDDFLSLEKSMSLIPLEYSIQNSIENIQTEIPRLLLKNLVENAIKHGIKQQETGGSITIVIQEKDNFIYISVDDTGKGRQHAISLDSGIGTTTYQKLFATLNPKNKENATFEIIDKEQGTKVEVRIPTHYKYS